MQNKQQTSQQITQDARLRHRVCNAACCACIQANVKTLSVRLGPKRVFWACVTLLELAYAGAIGIGALSQVCQLP